MVSTGTYNIEISGNAGTVSNGVYTTGSYVNPNWIAYLDGSKVTGVVANATNAANAAFATTAATSANFSGSLNGDITGAQGATVVTSIGGIAATNFARTDVGNIFAAGTHSNTSLERAFVE